MSTVYRRCIEPRTDWFRVLADLSRKGIGNRTVARRMRVSKGTVSNWKRDTEPRHSDGERLIAIWCEITGQTRDLVPQRRPFDWR